MLKTNSLLRYQFTSAALPSVLLASSIFLILLSVIMSFTSLLQTQSLREVRVSKALALGNGGINHALANYRTSPDFRVQNYRTSTGEIEYVITPGEEVNEPNHTITVQSYVPDKQTLPHVCRQFRAEINPETTNVVRGSYMESPYCEILKSNVTPPANTAPVLTIFDPDGVNDTVTRGAVYNVIYSLTDQENVVTAEFYYDVDTTPHNGNEGKIPGPCSVAPQGEYKSCAWNTSETPSGSYYVYGEASDGKEKTSDYSPGKITITTPEAPAPRLEIHQPDGNSDVVRNFGGDRYTIIYTLTDQDPSRNLTANFFYDTDTNPDNGKTAAVGCSAKGEGQAVTCDWNVNAIAPGNYYIHAETTNAPTNVKTTSPGPVTITANQAPAFEIFEPDGVNDVIPSGINTYTISYRLDDPDDTTTVDFYYVLDVKGDGTAISPDGTESPRGCRAAPETSGVTGTCQFKTNGLAPGKYWVYGIVNGDLYGRPNRKYSPGQFEIPGSPPVNVDPTFTISNPDGIDDTYIVGNVRVDVNYTLTDPDDEITAKLYYIDELKKSARVQLTGGCTEVSEGTDISCTADTMNIAKGKYYVIGEISYKGRSIATQSVGLFEVIDKPTLPDCKDNRDNDGDGLTDYPADPGCDSEDDDDEKDSPTKFEDRFVSMAKDSSNNIYIAWNRTVVRSKVTKDVIMVRKYTNNGVLCNGAGTCPAWGDADNPGTITYTNGTRDASANKILVKGNALYVAGMQVSKKGTREAIVLKYGSNGRQDNTFANSGKLIFTGGSMARAHDVAVDDNNNVYMAGVTTGGPRYDLRMNTDTPFGFVRKYKQSGDICDGDSGCAWGDGKTLQQKGSIEITNDYITRNYKHVVPNDIALDSSNGLYIVGSAKLRKNHQNEDWVILKYDSTGKVDNNFGGVNRQGIVYDPGRHDAAVSVTRDNNNRIFVTGWTERNGKNYNWFTRKYNEVGSLCNSSQPCSWAGGNGTIEYTSIAEPNPSVDQAQDIALGTNDTAFIVGSTQLSNWMAKKYSADGNVASGWGTDGSIAPAVGNAIGALVDSADNLFVGGEFKTSTWDIVIRKYATNGAIDTTFGSNGEVKVVE